MAERLSVSIVIPSCDRAPVLLDTIAQLLALDEPGREIIVVDQSAHIDEHDTRVLECHHSSGAIRWVRRDRRSIPAAMNHGAQLARSPVILFLDDDVRLDVELVRLHRIAHEHVRDEKVVMVAGQVIQPWQTALDANEPGYPPGLEGDPDAFRFNAARPQRVQRFMAGNVSVRRAALFALGGFDENFVGAAYRFEADFAQRLCESGLFIEFDPQPRIHHLKALTGGTRSFGHHLRTLAPWHSIGRYYYLLSYPRSPGLLRRTLIEVLRAIVAREHLRAPWRIVSAAFAEGCGFALALVARLRGPRLPLQGQG